MDILEQSYVLLNNIPRCGKSTMILHKINQIIKYNSCDKIIYIGYNSSLEITHDNLYKYQNRNDNTHKIINFINTQQIKKGFKFDHVIIDNYIIHSSNNVTEVKYLYNDKLYYKLPFNYAKLDWFKKNYKSVWVACSNEYIIQSLIQINYNNHFFLYEPTKIYLSKYFFDFCLFLARHAPEVDWYKIRIRQKIKNFLAIRDMCVYSNKIKIIILNKTVISNVEYFNIILSYIKNKRNLNIVNNDDYSFRDDLTNYYINKQYENPTLLQISANYIKYLNNINIYFTNLFNNEFNDFIDTTVFILQDIYINLNNYINLGLKCKESVIVISDQNILYQQIKKENLNQICEIYNHNKLNINKV